MDSSYGTGMTLFDFNQDSISEIVYRDMTHLRIIDESDHTPQNLAQTEITSSTITEYPIILDTDNDGSAEIVVSGGPNNNLAQGYLAVYKPLSGHWAPTRRVWNQYAYNAVNVNEDLTIPSYPIDPATVFAGTDGVIGTPDDVRPYNAFMQQQTLLDVYGNPLWLTPDVYPSQSLVETSVTGDSISITIGVINQGDAAIGHPVYVTLYKESVATANKIKTDSANIQIMPGDTGYITIGIQDITLHLPILNIIVRVNDDGTTFPYQPECDNTNNEITILNPALMKKNATLNGVQDNGTYPNPVSVLYGENIRYDIDAVNVNKNASGTMTITDTLPPYLNYVTGSATNSPVATTTGTPQQTVLTWTLNGLASMATQTVSYEATPESGASASQPLYINKAWVRVSDTIFIHTNSTYHQGAGVAIVSFSAENGGWIFNAEEQALDYKTTPRAGITVVPEEGYVFTGWSHNAYTSLRGKTIPANSSLRYEDMTIYGNVELRANFAPITEVPVEDKEEPIQTIGKKEKVWANEQDVYIRAAKGTIARIYSTQGMLLYLITITKDGITTMKLERGIYVVTLKESEGWKVIIE